MPNKLRTAVSAPRPRTGHTVILFDGVCNLCNAAVNFAIRRDKKGRFRFAPLQSPAGQRLQREHGLDPAALDTFVLIVGGRAYTRSGAALRMLRGLGGLYALVYLLILVPRPLRDFVYGFFARRRYRWFGRRDECMVPSPEVRERFLVD